MRSRKQSVPEGVSTPFSLSHDTHTSSDMSRYQSLLAEMSSSSSSSSSPQSTTFVTTDRLLQTRLNTSHAAAMAAVKRTHAAAMEAATDTSLPVPRLESGEWHIEQMRQKTAALPPPSYYPDELRHQTHTLEQLEQQLRTGRLDIPLFSAQEMQSQCCEAGTYDITASSRVTYPPCAWAEQGRCWMQRMRFDRNNNNESSQLILQQLMYKDEFQELLRTGSPPRTHRCCIVCASQSLIDAAVFHRSNRYFDVPGGEVSSSSSTNVVALRQLFRNAVDVEGGFQSQHVMMPDRSTIECFVCPFVAFSPSFIQVRTMHDARGRERRWLDLSAMTWNNMTAERLAAQSMPPLTGENLRDFC